MHSCSRMVISSELNYNCSVLSKTSQTFSLPVDVLLKEDCSNKQRDAT